MIYLIQRRGVWYRPRAHGYTTDIAEAGRFTHAQAERHYAQAEGVVILPVTSQADKIADRRAALLDKVGRLEELLMAVVEARRDG